MEALSAEKVLAGLLRPVTWDMSSSIRARQNYVEARHSKVRLVYPFLNKKQKKEADEWIANNKHSGLWD